MSIRTSVKAQGRVLYLTEDPALLKKQLDGQELTATELAQVRDGSLPLIDNISTSS